MYNFCNTICFLFIGQMLFGQISTHDISVEHEILPHVKFHDLTEILSGSNCDTYMNTLVELDLDSTAIIGETCQNLILAARAQKSIRLYTNTGDANSSTNDFHYVEITPSGDVFFPIIGVVMTRESL